MKNEIQITPYGEISSRLTRDRWQTMSQQTRISKFLEGKAQLHRHVLVTLSQDIDETFVEMFRKRSTPNTRLLIVNEGVLSDTLVARVLRLQIRRAERLYVADFLGSGKTHLASVLLKRLFSALEAADKQDRILDAKIEDGTLHVVSPGFTRLDVPIAEIPKLQSAALSQVQNFEIDEDGSFIYWPDFDLHLGWSQLQQIVDPEAARKVLQKSQQFNVRYGKAVQKLREDAGLKPADIAGLSEKQLRRIEKGECRLTSKAIEALSKALSLKANEYLQKLAEALST